jgi:hypothetical protein
MRSSWKLDAVRCVFRAGVVDPSAAASSHSANARLGTEEPLRPTAADGVLAWRTARGRSASPVLRAEAGRKATIRVRSESVRSRTPELPVVGAAHGPRTSTRSCFPASEKGRSSDSYGSPGGWLEPYRGDAVERSTLTLHGETISAAGMFRDRTVAQARNLVALLKPAGQTLGAGTVPRWAQCLQREGDDGARCGRGL